jgi:hypothetical protein
MGKINHRKNAIDHAISQGDHGVKAANSEAIDELFGEGRPIKAHNKQSPAGGSDLLG